MNQQLKPIAVLWVDSAGPPDIWRDLEYALSLSPVLVHTRGWLVKETDEFLTVAGSVGLNDQFGGLISIPKCAIKKRTK